LCSIVGLEHARVLIFREQVTIETMVLEKGCVEAHSELWGKKKVALKLNMDMPAIAWSHEFIAQGHIENGASDL